MWNAARVLGTCVVWASLVGCNHGRDAVASTFELPVHAADRAIALGAVTNLREMFNGGDCLPIYQGAAAHFRSHPLDSWIVACEGLHANLGTWRDFSATWVRRCGAPERVVCVSGSAAFASGVRPLETIWRLHDGRADLMVFGWQDGRKWIQIPPVPGREFHDPPAKNHPIVSAATRNP